jgi:hypothetical protein
MKLKSSNLINGACIALCLLMYPYTSMAKMATTEDPKEKTKAETEAKKARVSTSRNNSSVKIYPDILKRIMHVVAKDNEGAEIDFFVFDLEGTLVKHYKMKGGDHEKLTELARGKYVFHVFSGDEETATGNFDIR